MAKEIILKTILTIVGMVTTGLFGYLSGKAKEYKKTIESKEENEKVQNMALLMLLQSNLTNTFFVYSEIGQIPDYIYKGWLNLLKIYEKLGGDDYIHKLAKKIETWKVIKTDILKK